MICYMDRSWCSESSQCGNTSCSRNYTEEDRRRNENGVDLPISVGNFKTKECGHVELRLQQSDSE